MYRVISKNRATGQTEIIASDRRGEPLTKEQADKIAERFTQAETNQDIIYEVEQF